MKRFKVKYKRGHGPGGQRKNKVETCVVVTDPETGMQETCQATTSQARNLGIAVERLTNRVYTHEESLKEIMRNEYRKTQLSKVVRKYNEARNEVKDMRTGKKANMKKVLNGNIELLK